jgi:tRNA G37 N-methylase Trm5
MSIIDINTRSVDYAIENVKRNKLESRIRVELNSNFNDILPLSILGEAKRYLFILIYLLFVM